MAPSAKPPEPQTRHRVILVGFRHDFFLENKVSYCKPEKSDFIVTCEEALSNIPKSAKHQELTKHDPKVLNAMKSVGNLANKRYYKYTDNEKKQILSDLKSAYRDMVKAWADAGKPKKIKKKSYWDRTNGND